MRHLKTFESHNNYEDFTETEAFIKPNVSYCIQLNEVHYNPIEARLIVRYNVTDVSQPTQLYSYYPDDGVTGVTMFDNIEIDGVNVSIADLDTEEGIYQFTTAGEHIVKYTLKDPTIIGLFGDPRDPSSVKIGATFVDCISIISVEIPNSVTSIGIQAFCNCTGLTSVTIPNSVTNIGNCAFQYCSGLISVTIPNSVTSIGNGVFDGCRGLTSVTIGNSVTSIGHSAFRDCTSLTSVTIPNFVTSIGNSAFRECSGLISVINGSSVTTIEENAFRNCTNLTNITISDSVTSIGVNAFCNTNLDVATQTQIRAINDNGICYNSGK